MIKTRNADLDAEAREGVFFDTGIGHEPGDTVVDLVRAAGDWLAVVVGESAAALGMARMVETLDAELDLGGREEAWRDEMEENSGLATEWRIGGRLLSLAAYAEFGIVLEHEKKRIDAARAEDWLRDLIQEAARFRDRAPLDKWIDQDRRPTDLERHVALAENRWALDNEQPVDPAALAHFGGVSEGRIRNMMAGAGKVFQSEGGKIPAREAAAWLAQREHFYPSIWRDQFAEAARGGETAILPGARTEPVERPVFVPVSREGTVFHPGLRRNGSFTVGPKHEERHVEDYPAALDELHRMPVAYWRRPNDRGHWGIVRGIRWERLDRFELELFARDPSRRLVEL